MGFYYPYSQTLPAQFHSSSYNIRLHVLSLRYGTPHPGALVRPLDLQHMLWIDPQCTKTHILGTYVAMRIRGRASRIAGKRSEHIILNWKTGAASHSVRHVNCLDSLH